MEKLLQTDALIFISFFAGMVCTLILQTDWGYTYDDGEREQPVNPPQEMEKYRHQYGIDIPKSIYREWKKSFNRRV